MTMIQRFDVPFDFRVPPLHEAKIRSCLGWTVKPGEPKKPLPKQLVAAYYTVKRCCDILGEGMPSNMLAVVVAIAAFSEPEPDGEAVTVEPAAPPTFLEIVEANHIPLGELVATKFADKEVPGYYQGIMAGWAYIQIDGTNRRIPPGDVRLAKDTDFPDLKVRNLNVKL